MTKMNSKQRLTSILLSVENEKSIAEILLQISR